jgi:hypothetical protein
MYKPERSIGLWDFTKKTGRNPKCNKRYLSGGREKQNVSVNEKFRCIFYFKYKFLGVLRDLSHV